MRYTTIYSVATSLLTATAIPLGIPLGNERFAHPELPRENREISKGRFSGKFPTVNGEIDGLAIANKEKKREAIIIGEYDDPQKQTSRWRFPLGVGPEVSSTLDKRGMAGEFRRDAEALDFPLEQTATWSLPGLCLRTGPFCVKEKREAEAKAEAIVKLPGMGFVNPEGCDDPLICASLKEKREAEAEAEPIVRFPGDDFVNPEGCDDPIYASLKERDAAPAPIVLLPGEKPINPEGCDEPLCASL